MEQSSSCMQSPGVMSPAVPPLAAMIRAARSIASPDVRPATLLSPGSSRRAAIPAGSRVRPISRAIPRGEAVASSQGRPGRRTSPPISWTRPPPSASRACPLSEVPAAPRSACSRPRQSALPSAPAPDASQRSCHVVPGCSSSQSRIFSMPSFRKSRLVASPGGKGGASIRRITANRSAAVASHDAGTGRGGNLFITASASALSCRAAVTAGAAAVTSGPSRTGRPGSRAGNLAPVPEVSPASAPPAGGDGPACSR